MSTTWKLSTERNAAEIEVDQGQPAQTEGDDRAFV